MQDGGFAAAFADPPEQIVLERVETARAWFLTDKHLSPGSRADIALDSVPSPAQVPSELSTPGALGEQAVKEFVVFAAALCHRPAGSHLGERVPSRCGDEFSEAALVPADAPLDGLGEVLPQMEPVRDLDRVRCAGAGAFGIRAGTVPADHPRLRMFGQPCGQRGGVTAR
jgi:hypothetical protein